MLNQAVDNDLNLLIRFDVTKILVLLTMGK